MKPGSRLGKRVRALRLREGLSQAALAQRLGVSASYLNLIEHDRRPLSANLLIRLAQLTDLDLSAFAAGEDPQLLATVTEMLGDPVFEGVAPDEADVRDFVSASPEVARAMIRLHHAFT